jgi:hypothetical protein
MAEEVEKWLNEVARAFQIQGMMLENKHISRKVKS